MKTILFLIISTVCTSAFAFPAKFGVGPDNSQSLILSSIRAAQKSLLINVYQFDDPEITTAVIDRIHAGVSVEILIEGEPVGHISRDGRKVLQQIKNAMIEARGGHDHLYLMVTPPSEKKRRFRFDHAKYLVVDSTKAYVSSENFTSSGHAPQGKIGNRGWDVVLEDPSLAKQLTEIFRGDTDLSYGDIREIHSDDALPSLLTEAEAIDELPQPGDQAIMKKSGPRTAPAIPKGQGDVAQASLITSPHSLNGLIALIRSAHKTLDVEQMSLPLDWMTEGREQNPIVKELIRAAQTRGVQIRVLLNDDQVFKPHPSTERNPLKGNLLTAHFLQNWGACKRVPISAKIVDTEAVGITYIHNKGFIIDNDKALVSSINGTHNSVMNNREVAVLLESKDAAGYFRTAFDWDWRNSPSIPLDPNPCHEGSFFLMAPFFEANGKNLNWINF